MAIQQRFNANTAATNGAASGNLSMNDILAFQPVSVSTAAVDKKATVQQIQAIPYGSASLSGATYTVTLINFPADYTPLIGSKILVKFETAYTGSAALYLKIGSNSVPMLARGSAMGRGSITAGQIIEFTFIGTISDGVQTLTGANYSAIDNTQLDNSINGALENLRDKRIGEIYNSNDYWKVSMIGYYARPLVFICIGTTGLYDVAMFGQDCAAKLIRLGNSSTQVTYKYTKPATNGGKGYLYIKSNAINVSHTIFSVGLYSNGIGTLEISSAEEYNNATSF